MDIKWSKEEINLLINNYGNIKEADLLKLLPNRTASAIRIKTKRLGIRRIQRTSNYNQNFFEHQNILSSYWAGFIAADGYIFDNNSRLGIILAEKDKNHILNFAKCINYSGNFIERHRSFNKNNPIKHQFGIQLNSAKFLNKCLQNNFNITENKSLTLQHPNLDEKDLIYSFIIGYIDGDGSIGVTKKNTPFISIRGTYDLLSWIKQEFNFIIDVNNNSITENGNTFILTLKGKKVSELINFLNKIDVPKLMRKWGNLPGKEVYTIPYNLC